MQSNIINIEVQIMSPNHHTPQGMRKVIKLKDFVVENLMTFLSFWGVSSTRQLKG